MKGEIKFSFPLCAEQKTGKNLIIDNEIVIITGNPGSGKTTTICQTLLDLLFKKDLEKVFITRPTVQTEDDLGALPGDLESKLDPYLEVYINEMKEVYKYPDKIDKLLDENKICKEAIQFIRGKNIREKQALIVDEAQNLSKHGMFSVLTRVSEFGKIILIGDTKQKDKDSRYGLEYAIELAKHIPEIKHIDFKENHRSGVVKKIIDFTYGLENKNL